MNSILLVLAFAAAASAAIPAQAWKNFAHGSNARSAYNNGPRSFNDTIVPPKGWQCTIPSFSTPFDYMTDYGPAQVSPVDGAIYIGVICWPTNTYNYHPYLWRVSENSSSMVNLSLPTGCRGQVDQTDSAFEGYFTFLPDGGIVLGACGVVLSVAPGATNATNLGALGFSASAIALTNGSPKQVIIAGSYDQRRSWWNWQIWRAVVVTLKTETTAGFNAAMMAKSYYLTNDTTIMFSVDGKTMFNGHFNEWAPGPEYGLQYWSTPFKAMGQKPRVTVPACAQTRPWSFAADSMGGVYSTMCSGYFIAKLDKNGMSVWNWTAQELGVTAGNSDQQIFLTDDEKFVVSGSSASMLYIFNTADGSLYARYNLTRLTGVQCEQVYGDRKSVV